jgi:hypothetical protein
MAEWPDWTPPNEMIVRQPYLPRWGERYLRHEDRGVALHRDPHQEADLLVDQIAWPLRRLLRARPRVCASLAVR